MDEKPKLDEKFSKWHGIKREEIDWHPVIDESSCVGCGMCATTCGRGVYKFDFDNKKSKVVNPNNCLVGCQTCANLCPAKAINFADDDKTREKAQEIVKKFSALSKVAQELEKRKEELKLKGTNK
jgi:NAD-dependent dihydropyrimidine dehydrogenase PreA subunit